MPPRVMRTARSNEMLIAATEPGRFSAGSCTMREQEAQPRIANTAEQSWRRSRGD